MKRHAVCVVLALALAGCWEDSEVQPVPGAAFGPDLDAIKRFAMGPIRLRPRRDGVAGDRMTPGPRVISLGLPRILSPEDAARYRRAFAAQARQEWAAADAEVAKLENRLLVGHLLLERYADPKFEPDYAALRDWLAANADLPDAEAVHRRALKLKPGDAPAPQAPPGDGWQPRPLYLGGLDLGALPTPRLSRQEAAEARRLRARLDADLRHDRMSKGIERLGEARSETLLGPAVFDDYRMRLARRLFQLGRNEEAFTLAEPAAKRTGHRITNAHWIAGLSGWALKKYAEAAKHFEKVATAPGEHDGFLSAGAYWAARSHGDAGDKAAAETWMRRAAVHAHTFYGLLARRKLGLPPAFDWRFPEADRDEIAAIRASKDGERGLALFQVGRRALAGKELLRLYYRNGETMAGSYLALAAAGGLASMTYTISSRIEARDGERVDFALFPVPRWQPAPGFEVDRALIYAVMRQESAFSAGARSPAGARGLMQLMPSTAAFIADDASLRRDQVDRLYDPVFNVTLGQKYLAHLLGRHTLRNNLLFVLSAYNAGEGNLQRWSVRDDPLLFIEAAHLKETRLYVERVMFNLWAYRFRLGQPAPSLDDLAEGRWPAYHPLDRPPVKATEVRRAEQSKKDG